MNLYQDETKPVADRLEDILARMSLEQKLAQLQCMLIMGATPEEKLADFLYGIGEATGLHYLPTVLANADFTNRVQAMMQNELPIPALMHCEALNGLDAAGATIYPTALGLGATWNPDTVMQMAEFIRAQMLAVGFRQALSPVMDVARDPRWGRVGETYGEDPTLCATMSVAYVRGLQGPDPKNGVLATGKHFLGYALAEGGLNMTSNPIPPRELREVYAKPFQAAITEAGLGAMMNSYGNIDGEVVVKSSRILTSLLRDEMGFEGLVVSDYNSVMLAVDLGVSATPVQGGIDALNAGLDVELPAPYGYIQGMVEAVRAGRLDEAVIDRAVRRVLAAKFKLGLFENSCARVEMISEVYDSLTARAHSLKAAREAIVLLKNDGLLPLNKSTKKIAVIGPHADSLRLLFGCYTYPAAMEAMITEGAADMAGITGLFDAPEGSKRVELHPFERSEVNREVPEATQYLHNMLSAKTPTILASIRAKCPEAEIVYEKGCEVAGSDRSSFDAAVTVAKSADVVVLTLGGKYGWGTLCTSGEGVDSDDIGLTGVQEELAKRIDETGTPAVLVHLDSRPLSSEYIAEHYPAVIENWFPGDTGGEALADVLFGDYNPAGRLPMTAARSTGQIPIYAAHRMGSSYGKTKAQVSNKYIDRRKDPLFCFGAGKSYTTFAYSDLRLDSGVSANGTLHLSCTITNTGDRDGEEVVQVYVRDELASMLRPGKELAGFRRVAVEAGKTRMVHFQIRADQFAFLDPNMKWIVEAGQMTVMVGASSEDIRLTGSFDIENTAIIVGKDRGFYAKTSIE